MAKNTVKASGNVVLNASGRYARAYELAAKADADESFIGHVKDAIVTEEKRKMLPIVILFDLQEIYTPEELALFPVPDSEVDPKNPGSNQNVDKYTRFTPGQEKKSVSGSFYDDFFEATAPGKAIRAELDKIDAASKKQAGADKALVGMGSADRKALKKKFDAQRTTGRNAAKRAIRLHKAWKAVEELLGKWIGVRFHTDKKDDLIAGPNPIIVFDKVKAGIGEPVSVSSFMSMDPETALTNTKGGTEGSVFEEFMNTVGRGTGDESEVDGDGIGVTDFDTFTSAMYAIGSYVEETKNMAVIWSRIDKMKKGSEERVAYIKALGDLISNLNPLWNKINNEFTEYQTTGAFDQFEKKIDAAA